MSRKNRARGIEQHREDRSELLASLPLRGQQIREDLLEVALTHRSFSYENGEVPHNERLEFLGDSVLGLAVTHRLFHLFPDAPEGRLSRHKSAVVSMRALALLARRHGLGEYIRLGRGEALSGGRDRSSVLADTVEAIIGAVHLSLGAEASDCFVLDLIDPIIDDDEFLRAEYDYKTRLQEIAAEHDTVPAYEVEDHSADGVSAYSAVATVAGQVTGRGDGTSKKDAERAAAQQAVLAYCNAHGIEFSVFDA
ncbi:ribonuclease III [Helcobacillus sp. ACRRO]|uniref:ribonuclease III n=1 Tax=Helcobacillus sp. ACRRO TaxID=2918202 RepID=UPI001EF677CD|nr:ribonuclease III [Helcobacillus sp. ACRRO]